MENTFLNIKLLTIINEEETLTNIFNKISADFTDGKKILLVSFDLNANTILKRFTFCLDEHEITSNSDHVKNINGKNGGCISIVDDFDVRSIDLLKRTIEKLMLDRKYDYILIDRLNYLTPLEKVLDNGLIYSSLTIEMILNYLDEFAAEWKTNLCLLYREDKYKDTVLKFKKNI